MQKLSVDVHVTDPDTGLSTVLPAGSEPEAKYRKLITNPNVWEGDPEDEEPAAGPGQTPGMVVNPAETEQVSKMRKAELEDFAREHNIDISAANNNEERVALIEAALGSPS